MSFRTVDILERIEWKGKRSVKKRVANGSEKRKREKKKDGE